MTVLQRGARVYSSTGSKSHVVAVVHASGQLAFTHCGHAVDTHWYPDLNLSLPLCQACDRKTGR